MVYSPAIFLLAGFSDGKNDVQISKEQQRHLIRGQKDSSKEVVEKEHPKKREIKFKSVVRRLMSIPNTSTGLVFNEETEEKGKPSFTQRLVHDCDWFKLNSSAL